MPAIALFRQALRVNRESGVGLWRQARDVCALRLGPGRLDPWEYYFFEVYDARHSPGERRRFVGWRGEIRLDRAANTGDCRNVANDKRAYHERLAGHGLPLAELAAIYGGRTPDGTLRTATEAENWLRSTERMPLFVKPLRGAHGNDARLIRARDGDWLDVSPGGLIRIVDFVSGLEPLREKGVLFQECLRPSPVTVTVCGPRLTTVRAIVIVPPAGPELFSAVWRVPTGENVTDNFSRGKNGNIIAGIDLENGRVGRVVQGIGWENRLLEHHPDTGAAFGAFELPDWRRLNGLLMDAAMLLPGLRLQHWDVALTDRGPVLLEVNVEGGMRTHQIVGQRGLLDERLSSVASAPAGVAGRTRY